MHRVAERSVDRTARRAHDLFPHAHDVAEEQYLVERLRLRRHQPFAEHLLEVADEPRPDHVEFRL